MRPDLCPADWKYYQPIFPYRDCNFIHREPLKPLGTILLSDIQRVSGRHLNAFRPPLSLSPYHAMKDENIHFKRIIFANFSKSENFSQFAWQKFDPKQQRPVSPLSSQTMQTSRDLL